jgi:cytochrome c peroxidase
MKTRRVKFAAPLLILGGAIIAFSLKNGNAPQAAQTDGLSGLRAAEASGPDANAVQTCARCHVPPLFTEPGWAMHTADEIGIDDFQAKRSPDERYRTTPLKGLWTHTKGGFYHDGRFATLNDVLKHYDGHFKLELTDSENHDLVEYLKSL